MTLLEGPNLVDAATRAGVALVEVWASDDSGDVRCSDEVIAALSTTGSPQSPVAVIGIPPPASIRPVNTLVLWDVSDPGNAGGLVRTAAALGWDVAYTPGTADIWSPKVLRAGAGGHFATALVPIADTGDIGVLVAVAAVAHGGEDPARLPPGPYALIVGNEAHGLPESVTATTRTVTLDLPGEVESLNTGVAGAILMWQLGRGPSLLA
jgi:TrmH family RNA methyltransferase